MSASSQQSQFLKKFNKIYLRIKSLILPELLGIPTSCTLSVSSYLNLFISFPFFVSLHVLASLVAGSVPPYPRSYFRFSPFLVQSCTNLLLFLPFLAIGATV